ncbi:hypothetical protein BKA70DRAFT_1554526 [Coprinopsis sp. MPI-PUGE-AT-0042]|nr:hypothetical protein BKA70DRAFT_1554526 [Coprinopsis sp. MPI-PUGE-AT-0042]
MKLETTAAIVSPLASTSADLRGLHFEYPPDADPNFFRSSPPTQSEQQQKKKPVPVPPTISLDLRPRTAQACDKCRERKTKCSGDHPACARCLTRGLICTYSTRNPRARRSGVRGVSQDREKPRRSLSDRRASDSQEGSPASTSSALSGGAATPHNESNIRASNGMPMGHRPPSTAHYADSARAYRPYPSAGTTDSRNYLGDLDASLRPRRSLDSANGSPLDSLHYSYSHQPPNFETTPSAYQQAHGYPEINLIQGDTPGVSYACDPGYAPSIRSGGNGQSWPSSFDNNDFRGGMAQPRASAPVYPGIFAKEANFNSVNHGSGLSAGVGSAFNLEQHHPSHYATNNGTSMEPRVFSTGGHPSRATPGQFFDLSTAFVNSRCALTY